MEQSQSWRHGVLSEGDHSLATPCRAVQIPFAKERLHSGDLLWTGRQTSSNSVLLCSFSVLRLLKEGADPHTVLSSGGSLLHLVRASVVGDTLRRGFTWGWQHGGKLYIWEIRNDVLQRDRLEYLAAPMVNSALQLAVVIKQRQVGLVWKKMLWRKKSSNGGSVVHWWAALCLSLYSSSIVKCYFALPYVTWLM